MMNWSIEGGIIVTSSDIIEEGSVGISNGLIDSVSGKKSKNDIKLNAEGCVLVPGLINSHDHLIGNYYPKVGNGPYVNWLPWDNDLKSSPVYQERQQIENRDLYLLAGYRNLVSGVTTVSDHIPRFVAEPFYDIIPVKAIREYSLVHSLGSNALIWGEEVNVEYQKALKNDIPFITHISEGFDPETIENLKTLDRLGGLGDHSVLIHGIAFSESDMDLIKKKGASVVWCADSNMFMFNKTTNIKMLLDKGINVCIGTDSPMSGGLNLLYEMKFDKTLFKKLHGEILEEDTILKMVTENPAKAFHLKNAGKIEKGCIADLALFRSRGKSPANSVVSAEICDVMLVVIDGIPVYGAREFADVFDSLGVKYQNIVIDDSEKIITGDLTGLMRRISRAVGFKKELPFLPVEFDL